MSSHTKFRCRTHVVTNIRYDVIQFFSLLFILYTVCIFLFSFVYINTLSLLLINLLFCLLYIFNNIFVIYYVKISIRIVSIS